MQPSDSLPQGLVLPSSEHSGFPAANGAHSLSAQTPAQVAANVLLKQRHAVRPPVRHVFGHGPLGPNFMPAPVSMFRHPLLQHFTLSVFCKLPIAGMTKMADLRRMFLIRIILSVFQFRINKRCVAP